VREQGLTHDVRAVVRTFVLPFARKLEPLATTPQMIR
jgi:hypothetical protein